MASKKNTGRYLWRGGRKIELEKEEEFFTIIVHDAEELERVSELGGVQEVKPVRNRIAKVRVDPEARDAAMDRLRSAEMDGIAHHAYRPRGDKNTRYYLTDRIVVAFKPRVTRKTIESIPHENQLITCRPSGTLPSSFSAMFGTSDKCSISTTPSSETAHLTRSLTRSPTICIRTCVRLRLALPARL